MTTKITRREMMMTSSALGASIILPSAVAAADASPQDAAAAAMLETIVTRLLHEYPENATQYGVDSGRFAALRAALTNRSAAAETSRARWAGQTLAKLKKVARAGLSADTAMNLDVAQEAFTLAIEGWTFPFGDMAALSGGNSFRNTPYVVTQLSGAFVDIPDLMDSKAIVATPTDAQAYLARVEAYAGELSAEADRIDRDRGLGMVPPDFILDIVLGQMVPAASAPIGEWTLVSALRRKAAAAGLSGRYGNDAERLCRDKVGPAISRQIAALKAVRTDAASSPGIASRPQGGEWYRWALRAATTTTFSPDEIHTQGLEQIAKIQAEMDMLLKAQGLTKGTVGERMTALSTRPDLVFSNDDHGREQLLGYLNGRIADVRSRLPRAFTRLVNGSLVIKRVPPSIQDGAPNGYAAAGSIDGTQPGIYYINLKTTATWPRYSLPTLCYHEGIPGHIWQGEYANRLPLIRTHLAFNAYSEGWGLYAEQLADELGVYDQDPLGRLGYLQSMGFRACRLVVDTGLHAKDWTFDQALSWFHANTGMPMVQLRSEVQRYCAMPGQACGYKVGHNKINMLRLKAQTALGARYDLKRFDDAVVETGNVPLNLLERAIDAYIGKA
ncbi:DUF885 domain-containing protein [Sphingomonas sp. BAUL-RG-20F-R05-02]|uniref:DUF885 domain-containing protein n=1 Tax=Sphingomonas sp. BAUL-RG-20F-R05-02 TaxID=2914830 RepID=UPI001F59901D|nr:DUF885 family protein [Sphingomonas sp. BAUL-RG-20F-R05-02]